VPADWSYEIYVTVDEANISQVEKQEIDDEDVWDEIRGLEPLDKVQVVEI